MWAEIKEGEVGRFVPKGTFFRLGEDTLAEVTRIEHSRVYFMNGDVDFDISQVTIIEGK